jgi:sortase A
MIGRMGELPVNRYLKPIAALLVGAGVVVGLGAGWHWYGKVRHVASQQVQLGKALDQRWTATANPATAHAGTANAAGGNTAAAATGRPDLAASAAPVPPGTPIARLHLPTLGLDLVVVEGAADAQLSNGPGRIAGTHQLDEGGNAGIAGHRYPGVFWDLDRLEAGDPVVVETATSWLVYKVRRTVTVEPDDTTVLAPPAPGALGLLTLVTCEPKLSTAHRLVKQAELVRDMPRDGPRPREMSVRSRR